MYDSPDDDDDDDDISLVSRSPSPRPSDAMDVDGGMDRYDEYVRGASREVITVDTKLKPTNKGFALLAKLGWVEGQPVGLSGDGECARTRVIDLCASAHTYIAAGSRCIIRAHGAHPVPRQVGSDRPGEDDTGCPDDRDHGIAAPRARLGAAAKGE